VLRRDPRHAKLTRGFRDVLRNVRTRPAGTT
jgi:hypothetical protein